jgi:ABC-type Fe3+/spermidine/putrescine transport system ATPase subunit
MRISDKIAVMNGGRIVQFGTAKDIYNQPSDKFVSDFIGKINLVPATLVEQQAAFSVFAAAGQTFRTPRYEGVRQNEIVTVGVRPEDLRIAQPQMEAVDSNVFRGNLESSLFVGNVCEINVRLASDLCLLIETHPENVPELIGGDISVVWKPEKGKILLR